jgi:predicted ester cyclase
MKNLIFLGLSILLLTACNQKQRYTQSSPEIETLKAVFSDYNNKDYTSLKSHYADTAKSYINTIDNPFNNDQLIEYHKQNDAIYASRGFIKEGDDFEMVVTDDGKTWVNFWGDWKGTLKANGKELTLPLHVTAQFIDGKIVRASGAWDTAPIMLAMQEIEAAKNMPEAQQKIMASFKIFNDAWNEHDVEKFKSIAVDSYKRTANGEVQANSEADYVALMEMFFTAFPDIHFADNGSEFKDGSVYHHWIGTGTHKGDFMGNAPTGKKFKVYGLTITSYNDKGELLSDVTYNDLLGLYGQLGIAPPSSN